jgi:CBS-domain-containing membrane protein
MSARAAWRLEALGFTRVYRYEPGKSDWLANGLPTEGRLAMVPRAGQVARRDVPTCHLGERVADVRDRVRAAGGDVCLVVTDGDIVLGRLRQRELASDASALVDDVMEPGPTTIRPDELLESLVPRMKKRGLGSTIVTVPSGRLAGILYRTDAERRLAEVKVSERPRD